MADFCSPDSDQTTRTLLRRVLDTADSRTPRRRRSAQTNAQRTLLQTPSSKRQGSQTRTSARRHSYGTRSLGRLAHFQASGHLEEQTPRTLLKNILVTAPESSVVVPVSAVKPVQVPEVVRSSRRESSRGSLELHLPELEPASTLAPGLLVPGKRKQKLRLSVFQQEVSQGSPVSQEMSSLGDTVAQAFLMSGVCFHLNSSFSFVPPAQPQSIKRPGLARRCPIRRPVDVCALLQDLEDNSLTSALSGDNCRTPVATLPTDVVLEDTQPFSQPLVGCSLSVHHPLPTPSHTCAEDAQKAVGHSMRSPGIELQSHTSRTSFGTTPLPFSEPQLQPSELREAVGSQDTVEAKVPEGSSEDEDTSGRPASLELVSTPHDSLPDEQPHQFLEPTPLPGVATLSSEPPKSVPASLPRRTRTAGPRHRQDPYKAGLSHYMRLFSFYTKMPVEKKALEVVEKCLDKYFQHLCSDLEVFAAHAGRKTVKPEDLELLMRRQGLITDQVSLHVLVERYLPLEYRQLLIPCACSGNSVFPAQ
ncbi:centromere protein T [Acomys russatus]|uniref:centromere protein T n=1 Tax=Acomys russatus TaxID=60746 RepID=UPI0021E22ADB|nr:centromere protein T [Acomys russatus]